MFPALVVIQVCICCDDDSAIGVSGHLGLLGGGTGGGTTGGASLGGGTELRSPQVVMAQCQLPRVAAKWPGCLLIGFGSGPDSLVRLDGGMTSG